MWVFGIERRRYGVDGSADDGSMRNDKRQEALATIKKSTRVRVILISFKAGSTGTFSFPPNPDAMS